ncbi:S-layer homology domain-containing protein [Paenibacillus eucommiae]|uniref:SLH domain-containing protein n=1 Tax=Paenibacillus eucommiae TaxID=1355755 RepID=A0ABS4IMS8_9BACL|nr:S-layer homology domain-containing protein [Paenibacillus eucommiae]MBP1988805.1 hypothetical protein [Paenibacillus eucommiae]
MKKIKKSMVLSLALCMGLTSASAVAGAQETLPAWAEKQMQSWVASGLLQGDESGSLRPGASITRAEFIALVNRVFRFEAAAAQAFPDVEASKWYAVDIATAYHAGVIEGDDKGRMNPLSAITRQEAAVMLAKAFRLQSQNAGAYEAFSDAKDIAVWAQEAVSAMKEQSFVTGRENNSYAPKASITRAEAVVMMDNTIGKLIGKAGTYSDTVAGNMVIHTSGAKLEGAGVGKNLYLAPGIGSGDAALSHSKVAGNVYVQGGGDHSITIADSTIGGSLEIDKQSGDVRVVLQGTTVIPEIVVRSGGILVNEMDSQLANVVIEAGTDGKTFIVKGKIAHLTIASNVRLILDGAVIDKLDITAKAQGAQIELNASSSVTEVDVNAPVSITGKGVIKQAVISVNGVTVEQEPQKLQLKNGVKAKVAGTERTKDSATSGSNPGTGSNPGNPGNPGTDPGTNPGTNPDPVGSVKTYGKREVGVPGALQDYDRILSGEAVIDFRFTFQHSIFPVSEKVVTSAVDAQGKVWSATENQLKYYDPYGTNAEEVKVYETGTYFEGSIKALLIDGSYLWILTDQSVSRVKYM